MKVPTSASNPKPNHSAISPLGFPAPVPNPYSIACLVIAAVAKAARRRMRVGHSALVIPTPTEIAKTSRPIAIATARIFRNVTCSGCIRREDGAHAASSLSSVYVRLGEAFQLVEIKAPEFADPESSGWDLVPPE